MLSTELIIVPIFISCLIITSFLLNRLSFNQNKFDSLQRNSSLDGLRGILALSVLVHHFYITYTWKSFGNWTRPESDLLNNFGSASVSLFFLITGYLFLSKIQSDKINWEKLYKSRIKRIFPLYFIVTIIIIFITLTSIKQPYSYKDLIQWIVKWIYFRGSSLQDFPTSLIIAGVNWTLIYEWGFYFSLPIFYLIIHKKITNKKITIFSSFIFLLIFLTTSKNMYLLFLFSYPAVFYKEEIKQIIHNNSFLTTTAILFLVIYCLFFTSAYSIYQHIILAVIFCFIANGVDFFGILNKKSMKILGDISYSIYLIHGLILYTTFTILHTYNFKNGLINYYMYFPLIFLIVIITSLISYTVIEKPFLKSNH